MQNDDEKSLKQRQLEQVGSKGARAAADLATGGAYEKVRNVPVVGNVAKGVENAAGKAAGSLDKLNQRRINLPSRMGNINNNVDGDNTNPDNNGSLPNNEGLGNNEPLIEKNQDDEQEEKEDKKKDGNFFGDKSSDDNSPFNFDGIKKAVKAYKAIKVGMILAPILLIFIVIAMGFAMVFGPINSAIEYIKNGWDAIVSFFTPDQRELEEKYYSELARVQNVFESDQSVCVDINLITSTLTIGNVYFGNDYNSDRLLNDGNTEAEYKSVEESQSDKNYEGSSINNIEYSNKMSEQIVLLAAMQTKHKKYSLDSKAASYCKNTEEEVLVNSSNQDSFSKDFLGWLKGNPTNIDSSSPQLVAANDNSGIFTYSVPKAVREQNFEYYIYYPPFDTDGSCSKSYAEKKLKEKNEKNSAEVSIGNDGDFTESVYYWNLVNDFIPDYYDDYLPSAEPDRTETILDLADQVFLVYKQMGSSQTCTTGDVYVVQSSLCPNGIILDGIGTIDFEDYIAGVVSREADWNVGMEALKAQAVAARTYALNYTNYCQKPIGNSTNSQTFTKDVRKDAKEATQATAGEILLYNGKIFSAMYDSFCYDDKDCPDAKKNNDGTYSVTYTKVPSNDKHTITLSDSSQYRRITHGMGHAHGMSQLVSYQLASQGKTYDEILKYFYADGVIIQKSMPTANPNDGAVAISTSISNILSSHNSSVSDFNSYIFSQVRASGVGTRQGVAAAAIALTSGLYEKTGTKLPYELSPSGKYGGYGIDPAWGTSTGDENYPLNGLDCSGFVSWAIHNGGFVYEVLSANGWSKASTKREWPKGTVDKNALPGDLIYNAPPARGNGTTGHIRMIVAVNEDGYTVAEASSSKNGVRIRNISFTSTGSYYLVDMTNYYNTRQKVTDYPG